MRIGIDIMGGDYAPEETIKGALLSLKEFDSEDKLILLGDEQTIKAKIEENSREFKDIDDSLYEIVHTSEVIDMGENQLRAIAHKQDSSIVRGLQMVDNKELDGFGSVGNTGALFVGALQIVKNIPNVTRPAIFTFIPKEAGKYGILIDAGANADCKPENLKQFGILGSIYASELLEMSNPKVGLMNIGEEKTKGNMLSQSAFVLLNEEKQINFVGNIEGRDLFNEKADIVVCDGFTGNIALKVAESIVNLLQKEEDIASHLERFDFVNYGGTPILGINSPILVGHGISNAKAIYNMIESTKKIIKTNLFEKLKVAFN